MPPVQIKMSNQDVEDFIQQNRALVDQVETYRGYWESEKHWEARREFIMRNFNEFTSEQLDHLLSLSMVWANNVFLGCRCVNKTSFYELVFAEGLCLNIIINIVIIIIIMVFKLT